MALDLGELSGQLGMDISPLERAVKTGEAALGGFASSGEATAKKAGDEIGRAFGMGMDDVNRLLDELPKNAKGVVSETSAAFRALPAEVKAVVLDAKAAAAQGLGQIPADARAAGKSAATELGAGLAGAEPEAKAAGREAGKGFSDEFVQQAKDAGKIGGAALGVALGAGVIDNLNVDTARRKLAAQLNLSAPEMAAAGKLAASIYRNNFGEDISQVNDAVRLMVQNTNLTLGGIDTQPATEKVLALASAFDQDLAMTTAAVGQMVRTGMVRDVQEGLDILTRGLQGPANKADDLMETMNEYGTQFRKVGIDGAAAVGLLNQAMGAGARDSDVAADAIKEFSIRTQENLEKTLSTGKVVMTDLGMAYNNVIGPGQDMYKVQQDLAKGGRPARKAFDMMIDGLRGIKDPADRTKTAVALFGTQAEDLGDALYAMDPSTATKRLGKFKGAADDVAAVTGSGPQATIDTWRKKILGIGQDAIESTGPTVAIAGAVAAFGPAALGVLGPIAQLIAARSLSTAAATAGATAEAGAQAVTRRGWIRSAAVAMKSALRMAASWLIAIGPIALVIAAVVGLGVLIYKNWDKIKKWTGQAWNWVVKNTVGAWEKVKSLAIAKATALVSWVAGLPGRIVGKLSSLAGSLGRTASTAFGNIKDAASTKVSGLLDWVGDLPGRVVDKIGNLGGLLYDTGADIVSGMWEGLKDKGDWLKDQLWDWIKAVIPGPVEKALGISSPSKVMRSLARWIPAGLAAGIDDGGPTVDRAVARMAGRVTISAPAPAIGAGSIYGKRPPSTGGGGCACGGRPIVVNDRSGDPIQTAREVLRRAAFAGGG